MTAFADTEPLAARQLRTVIEGAEPLLRRIGDAESASRPRPGTWSPREIIGHLIDSASNNHQRFVRAAGMPDLVFAGYDQDGWVELQRYQDVPWRELLDLWSAYNRHLVRVMAAVPESVRRKVHTRHNLDQVAFQTEQAVATPTLEFFMLDYVAHLEHHLRQVLGADWVRRTD